MDNLTEHKVDLQIGENTYYQIDTFVFNKTNGEKASFILAENASNIVVDTVAIDPITENGSYHIELGDIVAEQTPGAIGAANIDITVDVEGGEQQPLEKNKKVVVRENTDADGMDILPSGDYAGFDKVTVVVDVPAPSVQTVRNYGTIRANGPVSFGPEEGYTAMSSVSFDVDVPNGGTPLDSAKTVDIDNTTTFPIQIAPSGTYSGIPYATVNIDKDKLKPSVRFDNTNKKVIVDSGATWGASERLITTSDCADWLAENIVKGKNIFGLEGTHECSGGGGIFKYESMVTTDVVDVSAGSPISINVLPANPPSTDYPDFVLVCRVNKNGVFVKNKSEACGFLITKINPTNTNDYYCLGFRGSSSTPGFNKTTGYTGMMPTAAAPENFSFVKDSSSGISSITFTLRASAQSFSTTADSVNQDKFVAYAVWI